MILIAESGSTKTHWCILDEKNKHIKIDTPGINPLILSDVEIENIIKPIVVKIGFNKLSAIHFFGAGCSTLLAINKIEKTLSNTFTCDNINVKSDLIAACYALAGNKPGIIGILGTGSNSCLWNGFEIEYKIPSLGYILGDEGGGVAIGKKLVSDFLKQKMPLPIYNTFLKKYNLTLELVINNVYNNSAPNRFLAGFAPFLEENIDTEYCNELIYNQFEKYFKNNILLYNNVEKYNIYFCGTIAFYHKNILLDLCKKYKLNLKLVIKEPINDLIKYFESI